MVTHSRACPANGTSSPSPLDKPTGGLRCLLHPKLAAWDHLLVGHDDPEKRIAELDRQLAGLGVRASREVSRPQ